MKVTALENSRIEDILDESARILSNGGIIVLPFDTVYGFIADPKNNEALEKIFSLKNRPAGKTLGVAVSDLEILSRVGDTEHLGFIQERTPGKFTFILSAKNYSFSRYCYRDDTIAVRLPDSELIRKITRNFGGVVAQTSANRSGEPACLSLDDIKAQFADKDLEQIDLAIDGGTISNVGSSEIWDLTGSTPNKIER